MRVWVAYHFFGCMWVAYHFFARVAFFDAKKVIGLLHAGVTGEMRGGSLSLFSGTEKVIGPSHAHASPCAREVVGVAYHFFPHFDLLS